MMRLMTVVACGAMLAAATMASGAEIDWTRVDQAIGKKGSEQAGGVHKFGLQKRGRQVLSSNLPVNRRFPR